MSSAGPPLGTGVAGPPPDLRWADFEVWGVLARVAVTDPAGLPAARAALDAELAAVEAAVSRFRPDSEVSRLAAAGGRAQPASPVLLDYLQAALDAAEQTGGLVDPTVGASLVALGYDRDYAAVAAAPSTGQVRVLPAAGWRRVRLDRHRRTVTAPPGLLLDLGATAKALTADRAAAGAAAAAGCGVLVSLGGDLAVAGDPPGPGWTVLVTEDSRAGADAPGQLVAVRAGGLATSSVTTRGWRRAGRSLHHLVQPATGLPVDGPYRTVSVAATSCLAANTASTAALLLGAAAPGWLAQRRLPARLVGVDGTVLTLGGWPVVAAAGA